MNLDDIVALVKAAPKGMSTKALTKETKMTA